MMPTEERLKTLETLAESESASMFDIHLTLNHDKQAFNDHTESCFCVDSHLAKHNFARVGMQDFVGQ